MEKSTVRLNKRNLIKAKSDFQFKYESFGYGSAEITFSTNDQSFTFGSTYVGSNPLRDFIIALDEIVKDDSIPFKLIWLSEPGLLTVWLIPIMGKRIIVKVFENPESTSCEDDNDSNCVFEKVVPLDCLVLTLVEEAERNLRKHGILGFTKDWSDGYDSFPLAAFLSLEGIVERQSDDLHTSSLSEEIEILKQVLGQQSE